MKVEQVDSEFLLIKHDGRNFAAMWREKDNMEGYPKGWEVRELMKDDYMQQVCDGLKTVKEVKRAVEIA